MLGGYAGRIGWVDLTGNKVDYRTLEEDTARKFLGGKGLGAHLLYENLKPGTDPLAPENLLVFVTGPLTGTITPGRFCTPFSGWPSTPRPGSSGRHERPLCRK